MLTLCAFLMNATEGMTAGEVGEAGEAGEMDRQRPTLEVGHAKPTQKMQGVDAHENVG